MFNIRAAVKVGAVAALTLSLTGSVQAHIPVACNPQVRALTSAINAYNEAELAAAKLARRKLGENENPRHRLNLAIITFETHRLRAAALVRKTIALINCAQK